MTTTTALRDSFRYVGLALMVVALFLIFAAFAVAMRPLMIVAALVAGIAGIVLYRFSPKFREWFESAGEERISYKGLHLATDVAVHPRHSWARIRGEEAVVGADELVESTLGPVEAVELPAVGSRVEQGGHLFSLRRGDRCVDVQAPLSGTIIATNEELLEHPELMNKDPFSRGWTVRIQADRMQEEGKSLLSGKEARSWFRQEIDRLLMAVLSHEKMAPSLPDGGTLVDDVYREIDDSGWKQLTETFFGMKAPA